MLGSGSGTFKDPTGKAANCRSKTSWSKCANEQSVDFHLSEDQPYIYIYTYIQHTSIYTFFFTSKLRIRVISKHDSIRQYTTVILGVGFSSLEWPDELPSRPEVQEQLAMLWACCKLSELLENLSRKAAGSNAMHVLWHFIKLYKKNKYILRLY